MAYADQQMSGSKITAIVIVALLHVIVGYGLVTGLAYEAIDKVKETVTAVNIEDPPEPPPPPPPPPEEPQQVSPPPPVAPPPMVRIERPAPQIQTVRTPPPPAPPVLRIPPPAPVQAPPPPPPAPPPPPSKARPATPDNPGRWAARIQGNYPSRALRNEEEGSVGMRITVGSNGRVEACSVTSSSGSSTLDEAACDGMRRYARYNPALNDAGNPITATQSQTIRYQLPE